MRRLAMLSGRTLWHVALAQVDVPPMPPAVFFSLVLMTVAYTFDFVRQFRY